MKRGELGRKGGEEEDVTPGGHGGEGNRSAGIAAAHNAPARSVIRLGETKALMKALASRAVPCDSVARLEPADYPDASDANPPPHVAAGVGCPRRLYGHRAAPGGSRRRGLRNRDGRCRRR